MTRTKLSIRVGVLFVVVTVLIAASNAVADGRLGTANPRFAAICSVVALAGAALAGLVGIRTTRTATAIETQLRRIADGDAPEPSQATMVISPDPSTLGLNALIQAAMGNTAMGHTASPASNTDRQSAPNDRRDDHARGGTDTAGTRTLPSGTRILPSGTRVLPSGPTVTLARAMRGLPVAWVITDSDGWVRFASPIARSLLGLPGEQDDTREGDPPVHLLETIAPTPDSERSTGETHVIAPEIQTAHKQIAGDLMSATRLVKRIVPRSEPDGETTYLEITRARLGGRGASGDASRGTDPPGMAWVINDITQRREAESGRHSFLLSAAHELRAPLQNLCASAEVLGGAETLDHNERRDFCNLIISESTRLASLVDQLLAVGQMESGAMTIHRYPLRVDELIEKAVESEAAAAAAKTLHLTQDVPAKLPTVEGDRGKLQAAINNLVANAVKYTPAGGNVKVQCGTDAGLIWIGVSDDGPGIAPEHQEKVFEKFYRAHSEHSDESIKGNGLGLAFARQVARLHGGDIHLHSQAGHGCKFKLTLPATGEMIAGIDNDALRDRVANQDDTSAVVK